MYITKIKTSKFYQVVLFRNGKRTTVSTKTSSKKKAQTFLENFISNELENKTKTNINITLQKFYQEYLKHSELSKSKHSIRNIKLSFNKFIEFSGNSNLNQINIKVIDQFLNFTFKRTEYSAALYYRTLKAAFSTAVNWEYIQINPFKKIKAPKTPNKFPLFISKEELNIIIENTEGEYLKNLFTLAFHTGMRLAEITNMKWSWIDINDKSIKIRNDNSFTTKSKSDRIIPINETVLNLLLNQKTNIHHLENDYIFYRVIGIKLNEDFVSKQFKKAVRRAKLNDSIHFHTLRHSFASSLVQKSVPLYFIKELLGHSSITTTQIYSHVKKEDLSRAVNML
ncbi:MAG: tyrosine-type recombinase/integrase [Bacteroidetes bacterium]|nr:tyrosine-type recombinase/integrase [Bacteroidota bacterium]MBU1115036.1 tyrosine-type recombinase/integrase [Bacteroidota bacterium]MBU1799528.1 tyrosine-type recombinase/integrase [Bacteroidota bacterium]